MSKLKLKKYPKKPRTSAAASTIKTYFDRCKQVDKDNAAAKREDAEQKKLATKLRNFKPGVTRLTTTKRRKAAPKKAAKKAAKRRR